MHREKPQTAICCLEWLGRFKCLATGLDAFFFLSFSMSRRCSRNRSPSRLPVLPMYIFLQSASYTVDDTGWGTGKMISDPDGSLWSRQFLNVANERTCFASCACSFKSSGLITRLECRFWLKRYLCFCRVWMKLMEVAKRFCQYLKFFRMMATATSTMTV